jgi:hypothetical protein
MRTKLYPLTLSAFLRVQARWKFNGVTTWIKITEKISEQAEHCFTHKKHCVKKRTSTRLLPIHYVRECMNLTGISTNCVTIMLGILGKCAFLMSDGKPALLRGLRILPQSLLQGPLSIVPRHGNDRFPLSSFPFTSNKSTYLPRRNVCDTQSVAQ